MNTVAVYFVQFCNNLCSSDVSDHQYLQCYRHCTHGFLGTRLGSVNCGPPYHVTRRTGHNGQYYWLCPVEPIISVKVSHFVKLSDECLSRMDSTLTSWHLI